MGIEKTATELVTRVLEVGIHGAGPLASARDVAEQHLRAHDDREKAIERLIATHQRILGASGFATGLPGLMALPITLPTDIGVLYVYQGRMAASIAHLRGHDLDSEEVQSIVLLSLLGSAGSEIAKKFGIDLSNKVALQAVKKVPGSVFIEINKKVGFRLITKAGEKGLINVTKLVPVVGGVVGAGVNVASTKSVGIYAKRNFPSVTVR